MKDKMYKGSGKRDMMHDDMMVGKNMPSKAMMKKKGKDKMMKGKK